MNESTIVAAATDAVEGVVTSAVDATGVAEGLPTFVNPVLTAYYNINGTGEKRMLTIPLTLTEEYGIEALMSLLGIKNQTLSETEEITIGRGAINLGFWLKWRGAKEKVTETLQVMAGADATAIPEGEIHFG